MKLFLLFGFYSLYALIDFPGCPENSWCTEKTGKKLAQLKKDEFLWPLWLKVENLKKVSPIEDSYWWASPCKEHNIEGATYLQGHLLPGSKKTKEMIDDQLFYRLKTPSPIKKMPIPRQMSPYSALGKEQFSFLIDIDGQLAYLSLPDHKRYPHKKDLGLDLFAEAPCPKDLLTAAKLEAPQTSFYQDYKCYTSKNWVVLMGQTCN